MKAEIEFTGYFRIKTGRSCLEAVLNDNEATVLDLLLYAEDELSGCSFKVLDGAELRHGVLVFNRNENGGLRRLFDLTAPLSGIGGRIIMANLMGGG